MACYQIVDKAHGAIVRAQSRQDLGGHSGANGVMPDHMPRFILGARLTHIMQQCGPAQRCLRRAGVVGGQVMPQHIKRMIDLVLCYALSFF